MWPDADDAILAGDLTSALAYRTPAGGVVLTAVAPIGMRERDAGTVSFTTSLGFGRKLERIDANPEVALAYHAREHGFASDPRFVVVQGRASYDAKPDREVLEGQVQPASTRFMGAPRRGIFWDRWLRAYYQDRVLVTVSVTRLISWGDDTCAGERLVSGEPLPAGQPAAQAPPRNGTAPRVDVARAQRRIAALPHVLLGWIAADGFPLVSPAMVGEASPRGLAVSAPLLPPPGRRAGLLAHRYEPQLIGLEARQYTGWLQDGIYAPHTEQGFRAPANKTVLLLANGVMARRGLKRARARGRA
jgi:hypothetical protein